MKTKRAFARIRTFLLAFSNIIYPKKCHGCGMALHYKNKFYLCGECFKKIKLNSPPFCLKCGRSIYGDIGLSAVCGQCIKNKHSFDRAFFCCNYDGLTKELIHSFKYENKKYLSFLFDRLMATFIKEHMDINAFDVVVPVPLHRGKLQQRGFDQALLLSENISDTFNIELSRGALMRKKDTKQQTFLDGEQRRQNVKGAFALKDEAVFRKKRVLLVDDVFTTGSTANECADILKKSGAQSVNLLTLARGV